MPNEGQHPADHDAAWSPDGQQVAFAHARGLDPRGPWNDPEVSGIYIANADGTGRRLLVRDAGAPAWSPDGRYLLFHRYPSLHIYRLELATGAELQLTSGDHWNRFPTWSPDGRRIAFDSNRGTTGLTFLHLMNPDGASARRVTVPSDSVGDESWPSFSPDGTRLTYAAYVRDSRNDRLGTEIFVIDTTGQNVRRLPHGEAPAWSPGGEWIAYLDYDSRTANSALKLVRPDGTGDHVIYAGGRGTPGMPGGRPAWSPDGAWLTFTARSPDTRRLWMIRVDGTGLRQLTRLTGE